MALSVTQRQGEAIIAVVLAALAAVLFSEIPQMPGGAPDEPGPAALPLALGVLLVATAGLMLLRGFLFRHQGDDSPVELGHPQVGVALLGLLGIALLFERLGALGTMALFLLVSLRFYGRLGWVRAALAAAIGALVAFVFFDTLLGVRLPRGILAGII